MKKWMLSLAFVVLLMWAAVLVFAGCTTEKTFTIDAAQSIEIASGDTGKTVTVTGTEVIQQITDNIASISFEREESSEGYSGWGYRIRWYDASGAELESLVIQGEALINDDGFFWLAADGRIDTALLDALLGIES